MGLLFNARRTLRKWFRNAGFQRRIAPDFFEIIAEKRIDVVLDIGANDGGFGRDIRDRGYKGAIVSFEPNPVVFDRLTKAIRGDLLWSAHPFALGEIDGEAILYLAENDTMSSMKGLTTFGEKTGARVTGDVKVPIVRLDTFLAQNPALMKTVYLKIDTQGFEMEILRGAGDKLDRISVVQAEISLVHTYADEHDWLDIVSWIRHQGFEVATAICNSTLGAQVREFDFVFMRR